LFYLFYFILSYFIYFILLYFFNIPVYYLSTDFSGWFRPNGKSPKTVGIISKNLFFIEI